MHVRLCPRCRSYDVHRSRRRGFVERYLLPLVLKRPYRCDGCNSRYYGYAFAHPLQPSRPRVQTAPKENGETEN